MRAKSGRVKKKVRITKKAAKIMLRKGPKWAGGILAEKMSRKVRGKLRFMNPTATIRGWVRAKAVKIIRDSRGRAIKALIKT